MTIDLSKTSPNDDPNIGYTNRIITALKNKVSNHNQNCQSKVNLNQLKQVFIEGASSKVGEHSLLICGFARVNMFLRLLNSESLIKQFKSSSNMPVSVLKGLVLNIASVLTPDIYDFISAAEDIENNKLDFNFNSINDLYIQDSQRIYLIKEYL